MGHLRLGDLPDTAPWRRVVGLVADEASVAQVANATFEAAKKGLDLAHDDEGLTFVVFTLAKVALAAREGDFVAALHDANVRCPDQPGVFDIVGGFNDAIDDHISRHGGRTDLGDVAQMAAVEALSSRLSEWTGGLLWDATSADVKDAVYDCSTKAGFAALAHDFFSRFAYRFLAFHLGRELSNHVGGNGRFASLSEHSEFNEQLRTHCRQLARIVRDFAGGWYAKANFEGGITARKARGFSNHALTKLRGELKARRERDVE